MFKLSKSKDINLAEIHEKANGLLDAVPFIKRRRKRKKIYKFLRYLGIIFVIFIVINIYLQLMEIITTRDILRVYF